MPVSNKVRKYSIQGCRADTLLGVWLVAEEMTSSWFQAALEVYFDSARMKEVQQRSIELEDKLPEKMYTIENGIARMSISGPTSKFRSSFMSMFGGTSTMEFRDAMREIRNTPGVRAVYIDFDTPGGTAEGTPEAAEAIRKTTQMMPVFGHAEDKCCSAGEYIASQCTRFTCGPSARIGSVGTMAGFYDRTKQLEKSGAKPIIAVSGKYKGMGMEGVPITEDHKKELQRHVDEQTEVFWSALSAGRPAAKAHKDEILTARVFIGKDAQRVGLVDETCSSDEAYRGLLKYINNQEGGVGGPFSGKNTAVQHAGPSPARSKTMLNAQQLAQARTLPGGSQIAEENADVVLLGVALEANQKATGFQTELSAKQTEIVRLQGLIPKETDRSLLRGHGLLCHKQIDSLVSGGQLTPAQATPLKEFFMSGDVAKMEELKFNAAMLTPDTNGKCGYETLLSTMELNKPNGITKPLTGAQVAGKTEPGSGTEKQEDPTGISLERQNELRKDAGLPPLKVDAKA